MTTIDLTASGTPGSIFMTLDEVATILRTNRSAVEAQIGAGTFPVSSVRLKVSRSELEAWACSPAADDIRELAS